MQLATTATPITTTTKLSTNKTSFGRRYRPTTISATNVCMVHTYTQQHSRTYANALHWAGIPSYGWTLIPMATTHSFCLAILSIGWLIFIAVCYLFSVVVVFFLFIICCILIFIWNVVICCYSLLHMHIFTRIRWCLSIIILVVALLRWFFCFSFQFCPLSYATNRELTEQNKQNRLFYNIIPLKYR